jgi:hypothetical protein
VKYMKLFLLGVVPIVWGAFHIISSREEMVESVKRFCGATHAGEPWTHVLDRAKKAELEFQRANASTEKTEEWLAAKQAFSQRYGCRVMVAKGLVTDTRTGELPAE